MDVRRSFRGRFLRDVFAYECKPRGWSRPCGRVRGAYAAIMAELMINTITGGATFLFVIRKSISGDRAYKVTKVNWENIDEINKSLAVLEQIKKETPLIGANTPLHRGAIRYYREAGVKTPSRLIPPEAR